MGLRLSYVHIYVHAVGKCMGKCVEMWDIVARGANFGMAVAYMTWAEQRAIYIVGSTFISVRNKCV